MPQVFGVALPRLGVPGVSSIPCQAYWGPPTSPAHCWGSAGAGQEVLQAGGSLGREIPRLGVSLDRVEVPSRGVPKQRVPRAGVSLGMGVPGQRKLLWVLGSPEKGGPSLSAHPTTTSAHPTTTLFHQTPSPHSIITASSPGWFANSQGCSSASISARMAQNPQAPTSGTPQATQRCLACASCPGFCWYSVTFPTPNGTFTSP